ncbi:MAG: hypothetical protein ABI640_18555 [Gammaproteobacteria bacterium]
MKLGARIAFVVSLAANVAALYLLLEGPRAADAPLVLAASAPPAERAVQPEGDALAYRDDLLTRGLSLEETKPLVLARLMAELAPVEHGDGADDYWRSGYAIAAVENVRQRVAEADRVRARLLELYGAPARQDLVFAPVFEPLDARYAFLTPEQQLALQKLQLDRQAKIAKGAPSKSPPAPGIAAEPAGARASPTVQAAQELREGLGADAALQYLYRFSPLADQLRSANVDLSAAGFRSVFDTLLKFEAATDPQTFTRTREALRSALGDARFTQLWAVRDPLFGLIAAEGRQQGLADGAISASYAVFNDAQDRLAAAADRLASVDPRRAASELSGIQQDMQQRLANLVGQDVADALVRASMHFSISMQPTSSAN